MLAITTNAATGKKSKLRLGTSLFLLMTTAACAVRPEPVSISERVSQAIADQEKLFEEQQISGSISLYEAMARGIKYNRDHRIAMMEVAIASGQLDLSNFNMLPRLAIEAGYHARTNDNAATSLSVLTGRQTLEPSTSQERDYSTGNIGLTWDILDFGLSYVQAQQNADRMLIAEQRKRKATQNLIMDIRYAFWRAAAAQALKGKVDTALKSANEALKDAELAGEQKLQPALTNLKYQQTLLEVIKQLEKVSQDLQRAETELARLLSIRPGTKFKLEMPKMEDLPPIADAGSIDRFEDVALALRPELYEADYKERIANKDIRRAMLRALPGIQLSTGGYFTTNDFTYNDTWGEAGARFTWNLLDVFSYRKRKELAKTQKNLAVEQRIALSMAIISQVRISHQQVSQANSEFERASQIKDVNQKIADLTQASRISAVGNKLSEIRAMTAAIAAELTQFQSYAQAQNAYGRFYASLGLDPLPGFEREPSVDVLADTIKANLESWGKTGSFDQLLDNVARESED